MTTRLPSPKRFLLLALIAFAVFGLGSATVWAASGVQADRTALAEAESRDAAAIWMDVAKHFEALSVVDPFLLPVRSSGDAAALYWPDDGGGDGCALTGMPRLFGHTEIMFERWPEKMLRATRCSRIDDIVQAAQLPELDIVGQFDVHAPGFDYFRTFEQLAEPRQAMLALLTRAHAGIRAGDFRNAERDARAVVSTGRQLVLNSPEMHGLTLGLVLLTGGLDHLAELYKRNGEHGRAAAALAARDSVDVLRLATGRAFDVGGELSRFPSLLRHAVAAAENEGLPLGLRSTMVVLLGYGHLGNFIERNLRPSGIRRRALDRLGRDPDIGFAVAEARKGLGLTWQERRDMATRWNP